jgi:predicted nucleotidyltransferase
MVHPDLAIPTIDIRKRIPKSVILNLSRQIAGQFKPQKIILFGSYARDNPRPESEKKFLAEAQ